MAELTLATWGTPEPIVDSYSLGGNNPPQSNRAYQMDFELQTDVRLTEAQAGVLVLQSIRKLQQEHPELEMKYMELTTGSPQIARVQFVSYPQAGLVVLTLAAVAAAIVAIITWVAAHWLIILIVSILIIAIWGLVRWVDYKVSPTRYKCPKRGTDLAGPGCDLEFTYYELTLHYQAVHSDQEPPPKPPDGWDLTKYITLGIGVVVIGAALYFALPLVRGAFRKEKK